MKNLIIIGASGFGREVYHLLNRSAEANTDWTFKGFLDDDTNALEGILNNDLLLSTIKEYSICKNDVFITAIGSVTAKTVCTKQIEAKGGEYLNLNFQNTPTSENNFWGVGNIIMPMSLISNNVTIGNHNCIQAFSGIGHDVIIGSYCQINSFAFIGGNVRIGDGVTIHPHACILPGAVIEDGATVGAGTVVLKKVKAGETVFGVPAKKISF